MAKNPLTDKRISLAMANKEIEAASADMTAIYKNARMRINDRIRTHFSSYGKDPLTGKHLTTLLSTLEEEYIELEEHLRERFDMAIPYVAQGNFLAALHDTRSSVVGKIDKSRIELMVRDAFTHVAGATQNMQKSDVQFLRQISSEVFREASMTGETRQEVSNRLLGKILSRPEKFTFTDAGGRSWSNDAYVSMLSRTVLHNVGRETYFDTCIQKGKDVVRVSVSGDSCPMCEVWENRLLSITGETEGLPTVAEAESAGLFHPNCTHSLVAVGSAEQHRSFDEAGRPKRGINAKGNEKALPKKKATTPNLKK